MADNPYVGPRPFEYGETLYGRTNEALDLQDLLVAERIVMLYSPSGAGKTSLLQAALIPRLEKKRFEVLPVIRVNRELPPTVASGNRYVLSTLLSLDAAEQPDVEGLAALDLCTYLERRQGEGSKKTLLIFDQFEEVLTLDPTDQEKKEQFFAQLGEALRERQRFALFSLREDYVGGLDPYLRPVPTRLSTRFRLELLRHEEAVKAMREPAKPHVDFTLEAAEKLAANLSSVRIQSQTGVREVPGRFIEPVLLQVVCSRLWEKLRTDAGRIDVADLEGVGDVDQALADYYGEKAAKVAEDTGVSERVIRDWCEKTLITEQGIRGQVLHTPDSSQGLPNSAIGALVKAHLVRPEDRRDEVWYELAHDRLIDPVKRSNAEWWSKQAPLMRAARRWQQSGGDRSYLYAGEQLSEVLKTIGKEKAEPMVGRFLEVCEAAEEDRNEKEQAEERQKRRITWMVAALGGSGGMLLGLVVVLILAFKENTSIAEVMRIGVYNTAVYCIFSLIAWLILMAARSRSNLTKWLARLTRKHRMDRSLQGTAEPAAGKIPVRGVKGEGGFEPWEARTLQFAPFWTFLAVAGVDGAFTRGEAKAFLSGLKKARKTAERSGARIRVLFPKSVRAREAVLNDFIEDPRYAVDGLRDAASVLMAKTSSEEAANFKAELMAIGRSVARKGDAHHREAAVAFVENALEGIASDAAAVRTRYYRQSGLADMSGILKAAAIGSAAAIPAALLHAWVTSPTGLSGRILVLRLGAALLFGGAVGGITASGLTSGKVRSVAAVNLVSAWTALVAAFVFWMRLTPGESRDERNLFEFQQWIAMPVMAFASFFVGRMALQSTFCELCGGWCKENVNFVQLKPVEIESLRKELESGNAAAIEPLIVSPVFCRVSTKWLQLDLDSCEQCGEYNAISVTGVRVDKAADEKKRRNALLDLVMVLVIPFYKGQDSDRKEVKLIDRLLIPKSAAARIREIAAREQENRS